MAVWTAVITGAQTVCIVAWIVGCAGANGLSSENGGFGKSDLSCICVFKVHIHIISAL